MIIMIIVNYHYGQYANLTYSRKHYEISRCPSLRLFPPHFPVRKILKISNDRMFGKFWPDLQGPQIVKNLLIPVSFVFYVLHNKSFAKSLVNGSSADRPIRYEGSTVQNLTRLLDIVKKVIT